ncbi:hypothetical protein MNBD_ALPHA02-762 [hydrothermal vent metagenome]|uniref:Uncharacterized protein n=1 Tax=hydrothermal vent metagenome TaxID=652676 RepID=A0A3B0S4A9_9ZZZZ
MPHITLENTADISDSSFLELAIEMKSLGMDPRPFFEIAAQDILSQHGNKAISYVEVMLSQMYAQNNPDGLYLWQELHDILIGQKSNKPHTIH